MSESEHIKRVLAGDTDAFRYFIQTYQSYAYTLALRIVRQPEMAEEVVQDAFLKAFRGLRQFNQDAKFSTWLYPIVTRQALSYVRKKKLPTTTLETAYAVSDTAASAAQQLEKTEQRQLIEEVLQRMKPKERLVLQLFYLEEQSIQEVETITGFSSSNVKVLLHRARKSFEQLLPNYLYQNLML